MKIATYYHTLKYIKPSQIYYRLIKKIIKPKLKSVSFVLAEQEQSYSAFPIYPQKLFPNNEVSFLNVAANIESSNIWNNENLPKLWLYNLHYFDDLVAFNGNQRAEQHSSLINRWMLDNPPLVGNGWEPYPSSLRIVNWIKAFLSHIEPSTKMLKSLAEQTEVLSNNLEKHLLGNHLFANAKALIFAGLFFEGGSAKAWLTTGLKIFEKELQEQTLKDGANFELTPMYHAIMLVDLLDILNISNSYKTKIDSRLVTKVTSKTKQMLAWHLTMLHQDNKISFFNDSAFGISVENNIILDYAKSLGVSGSSRSLDNDKLLVSDLKESGYVVAEQSRFKLIMDCSAVGPDYIPGHAHADSLSFELSVFGQRFFVNSGISEYGLSQERLRQRKTAAHNTVSVNELDSSQVWSGFRVAKRARIVKREIEQHQTSASIIATHDGFVQQGIDCLHQRQWQVTPESITVSDNLTGTFEVAHSFLHLHPDVEVLTSELGQLELVANNQKLVILTEGANIKIEDSHWFPEFGMKVANKRLRLTFINNEITIKIVMI